MAIPRGPLPALVAAAAGLAVGAGAGALVVALVGGAAAGAPAPTPTPFPADRLVGLLLSEADVLAIPPGTWALSESSETTLGELIDPEVEVDPADCAGFSLRVLPGDAATPVATALARGGLGDGGTVVQHRIEWFPDAAAAAAAFDGLEALFAECAEVGVTPPGRQWAEWSQYGLVAIDPGGDGRLRTVELERSATPWGDRIVFQLSGNVVSSLTLPSPQRGWVAQLQYDHLRERVDELLSAPVEGAS